VKNGAVAFARPMAAPVASASAASTLEWRLQLSLLAVHVPLAFMIAKHSKFGTLHGLVAFGLGLVAALVPRRPEFVACAAAYITSASVYWRMRAAPYLPWEFGKYAIVVLFALALVFSVRMRRPMLPLLYIALLLPSIYLTTSSALPPDEMKEQLSFNMSGPLALAAAVMFFSSVRFSPVQFRWILVCLIAPIVTVATLAARSLEQALEDPDFEFYGGSSNAATSGGFGPNQVSAILGLGMAAIFLYLIAGKTKRGVTGTMLVLFLFFTRQCLITLSRGGLWMLIGAVIAASAFLIKDPVYRKRLAVGLVVVGAIVVGVVIPRLDAITGGVLVTRLENTAGTGREELIRGDLESFESSPLLGVGPGMGGANRLKYFDVPTAHTEYTRMAAEHGVLGLVSLIVLGVIALRAIREPKSDRARAICAALLAYALLFMVVDAMRMAAPSFAFGLACATLGGKPKAVRPPPGPARRGRAA
jgi:hypothetical protein